MVEVVVTGIGLMSALGNNLETTWRSLLAGESAIALRQPFLEAPVVPLAMMAKAPINLGYLVDRITPMALQDAGFDVGDEGLASSVASSVGSPFRDWGVVLGSSRSDIQSWEALAQIYRETGGVPSERWIAALPHQAALRLARLLGSQGPVLAPMAACATGIWALAQAYELLQTGQCERVIAGAVEAPVTPLCLAGFAKMGAQAKTGCYPFDVNREGLVLGEGGAVVVMETAEAAHRRGRLPYGRVLGFGLSNDAYHVSSPRPGYEGAIASVNHCLKRSRLRPEQIGYIHAHGTATQLNDRMEATIVQTLFSPATPISSTKGATGHTVGASGVLGAAFSLMALRHQMVPPAVGLSNPAFELNFVRQAQSVDLDHVLCCSFGFGGQNAAIALGRYQ